MGGYGCGFRSGGRRTTVEECPTLSIQHFRDRFHAGSSGTLSWTSQGEPVLEVKWSVQWPSHTPKIALEYLALGREPVRILVTLQTTPSDFGGVRQWFQCPLAVNGSPCNRRVGRLYLPPGTQLFGCRECHRLSYRSSQEAHRDQRLFGGMGFSTETAQLLAATWK